MGYDCKGICKDNRNNGGLLAVTTRIGWATFGKRSRKWNEQMRWHFRDQDQVEPSDILVPPLFIEENSHSYNQSIFVFAGATVPY